MASPLIDNRPVVSLPESDRATFIGKVYSHIGMAIAAFAALSTLLMVSGVSESIHTFIRGGGRGNWMILLGGFMVGSWLASSAAGDLGNITKQYVGLFGMSAVYSLLFAVPFYEIFSVREDAGTVGSAVFVTAALFAGLTITAYFTKSDLSWMRPIVMFGGIAALIMIVASLIFNVHLGAWFSFAMIGLMGASILYKTQEVIRRYPSNAYVGAAVQLFSSVMTMFWYVLRLFMSRD